MIRTLPNNREVLPATRLRATFDRWAAGPGITWTLSELDETRRMAVVAETFARTARAQIGDARAAVLRLATAHADGDADLDATVAGVLHWATQGTDEARAAANKHISAAADLIDHLGARPLLKVTEAKWLAPLRKAMAAALKEANMAADAVEPLLPARLPRNTRRSALSAVQPTMEALRESSGRYKWDHLGECIDRVEAIHDIADTLRIWGLLPRVPGLTETESYHWLHLDKLDGDPYQRREFFLGNREGGAPGIYAVAELSEAGAPQQVAEQAARRQDAVSLAVDTVTALKAG